jgi:hypothetical protein
MEAVKPANWIEDKAKGMIKAPGYKKGPVFKFYDAPSGAPFKEMIRERADIRTRFVLNNSDRKTLPKLGGFKFGMMNFGSETVRKMDMSKMAKVLPGNGVKEELLSPSYKSFPEISMTRYDQERGQNLDVDRIVIPKVVRQDVPVEASQKKVVTILVPSWELSAKKAADAELARMKAVQEEEFVRLKAEREAEKRRQSEPTSLIGAVKALNERNSDVRVLTKNARPAQGAQQRLRDRSLSGSSVQYLGEVRRSPEREGERGTTSRTTARTSSPKFAKAPSVKYDSGEDSSNNEEMDKIRKQRCVVQLETVKLERMEKRYTKARLMRK